VLVDPEPGGWGWPLGGKPRQGFRRIAQESYASLYVVTAQPKYPALVAAGEGLKLIRVTKSGPITWLFQKSGTLELAGTCAPCNGTLSMILTSYARPRQITVSDSYGHVIGRAFIAKTSRVTLPLSFTRHTSLELETTPGPEAVPVADRSKNRPHDVSLQMTDLEFLPEQSPAQKPAHNVEPR
jgi:hypothetical protein